MNKPIFLGYIISFIFPFLVFGPAIPELFLFIAIFLFLYQTIKNNDFKIFNNYFVIIFFIFNLILILNSLISVSKLFSLESSLFYFRFIFYSLIIYYLLRETKLFKKLLLYVIITTFSILSFDSVMQFLFGQNLIGFETDKRMNQVTSFFGNEKKLGSFIVRILPIYVFLYFTVFNKTSQKNIFYFIFSIIIFSIPVIISGERTAIFLLLVFLLFLSIFNTFNIYKKITCVLLLCIIFIFSIALIPSLKNRIIDHTIDELFVKDEQITIFSAYHTSHYLTAFNMFIDRPILGHGTKTFRVLCEYPNYEVKIYAVKNEFMHLYKNPINIILKPKNLNHVIEVGNGCSTHPHNTYFQLMSETGLIGFAVIFLIFIISCYYIFKYLFRLFKNKNKFKEIINVYLFIAIFLNYFPLIPSGNFFNNWLNFLYFLPYGFLLFYQFHDSKTFYVYKK